MSVVGAPDLQHRRVLLAVSGGVAAYKAAELCRLLVRSGASVQVAMTAAAQHFVGAATFAALSGRAVATDLFDAVQEEQIGHIALADAAEVLVVAPATADLLAKLAAGLAGDVVTTAYLAFEGPVLLAPAMNVKMWRHPATQQTLQRLRERGHRVVGPESGELACGHVGAGRMSEPGALLEAVWHCLAPQSLAGQRILVSAGPTREALDPVRHLTNRSSGKMGYALAAEAAARGATVTLVSGPTALATPLGVQRVDVTSAAELAQVVLERVAGQDAVVMTAAVADYRPAHVAREKLAKERLGEQPTLTLTRTVDVLAALGAARAAAGGLPQPLLVGFAAETGIDEARVIGKLAAKQCDLLVVNDVSRADAGFDADDNRVVIYHATGNREALPLLPKREVAGRVLQRVAELLAPRLAELASDG
ncbi:MAG: bifunctional phosphopantothenoylcysteine decarboxylase/phosphopantothenate--cysteine ligase CoaBC [Proteobacteria bacterium]|nr:bifunctional phosphopantothenoylcysteine decarboxylase/phosphopantothenate--cysteine ligase CoaBC [Pseudomonadota bacterium]